MGSLPRLACYRLIRELGRGANSAVYLAQSVIHGQISAVKIIKTPFDSSRKVPSNESNLLFPELETLSTIDHPNVIRLLDFGQTLDSNSDFVVTEYVEGLNFVTYSKDASQHHFYSMIVQVCRALDYLHSRGITHGDLKSHNILVTPDASSQSNSPTVKLIDLGYATTRTKFSEPARMGSPHYLAPEVIRGEMPTIASDLYSLGAILYECLTGSPPFSGTGIGIILQKHLQEPPPRIETRSLVELHPLIYQLLSKTPDKRPSSPSETIRLINSLSTVGQFRLQTADTWAAYCRSSPLVAREKLLSEIAGVLLEIVGHIEPSKPSFVLLSGEGGSGKTRLAREVAVHAKSLGYRVLILSSSAHPNNNEHLYGPIREMFAQRSIHPLLLVFDGLTSARLLEVMRSNISLLNQVNLVVLITVDTSRTNAEALDRLARQLRPVSDNVCLSLRPLKESDIRQAIAQTIGLERVDERVAPFLHAQSGGNPFFFVELLAACLDKEIIVADRGSLALRGDPKSVTLPSPIDQRLRDVLDALSAEELKIVQLLAVADDELAPSDLATLLGVRASSISILSDTLAFRGILQRSGAPDSSKYSIASALLSTAAHDRIPEKVILTMHERLGRWYLSTSRTERSVGRAALNLIAAGIPHEGIAYCIQVARSAAERSDYHSAARFQRVALDQGPNDPVDRAEIILDLASYLCRLGKLRESQALLDSADVDLKVPTVLKAKIGIWRARCARFMGQFMQCEEAARYALQMSAAAGLAPEAIEAMLELGPALCWLDRRVEGEKIVFQAARKARRSGLRALAGQAMGDIALLHWQAGDYRLALNYQRRSWLLLRNRVRSHTEATSRFNIGVLLSELGLYTRSRFSHRKALSIAQRDSMNAHVASCFINIGETYRAQGRWPIAISKYRSAKEALDGLGAELALLTANSNMAYAFARAGHYEEALRGLRHKMRVAQRFGSTQAICLLLVSWAVVLISTGRYDSTSRLTAFACRHAEGAGLWGSILELKVLMALSMAAGGKLEEARDLLSSAIESFKNRAPFDIKLGADIALSRIEQNVGAPVTAIEERLKSVIQTARAKKMRWHLASALMLRAEGMLATNRLEEAEVALQEASATAESTADRCLYWQASYLMGRVFEQRLQYERALSFYRAAALTIHELALDLEDEKYKAPFLEQPKVREVLERFDRLRGEVGKRVRFDLAAMSRSEKISRRMLGALNAIGQKLASILDLNELLAYLLDLSIENVRAERGIIFLLEEASGEMRLECARGMDKGSLDEVSSFSRSVIRQVAQGQTLLTVDVGKDPALSAYKSLVLHEIKSILCVPMKARGKVAGVIYLDTRRAAQLFTDRERAFVESFASQAAIAIENARLFGQMSAENVRLRKEVEWRSRFDNLIGTSPAMKKLTDMIAGVLDSDCGVLIVGESGTGKELVARAIHYNGPRRKKEFMAIDCGALPENLLEAELFGYVRGAFTGADKDRVGLIEQAHGGSLFLDEITNTSLALQARLLRVLQEHEVRRLGENRSRRVDVRVIAATNSDMSSLVRSGHFRQDLYYRLDVVTIAVPALRERREDIPLLADHFLKGHTKEGIVSKELGPGVRQVLSEHDWPGNVRELQNVIQRAVVLARGSVITVNDLPEGLRQAAPSTEVEANGNGNGSKTGEQLMIEDALRRFSGDKAKAARFIGWNRQKLYRRMKTFSIPPDYGRLV